MTKAKHVRLTYGVAFDADGAMTPITDHIQPYSLKLLDPVDGIEEVSVRANTLREVLSVHEAVSRDARPGTSAYGKAALLENVRRRCTPALTQAQLDQLAGADYDALVGLIDTGTHPETGAEAFKLAEGVTTERDAYLRLHTMADRAAAEQRLLNEGADETVLYHAHLTYLTVRFGEPHEGMFGQRQVAFHDFLNITWQDFQQLTRHLLARDYKPLTEILDGKVEVDGKPLPFPGVPEEDAGAPEPKDGKRRGGAK